MTAYGRGGHAYEDPHKEADPGQQEEREEARQGGKPAPRPPPGASAVEGPGDLPPVVVRQEEKERTAVRVYFRDGSHRETDNPIVALRMARVEGFADCWEERQEMVTTPDGTVVPTMTAFRAIECHILKERIVLRIPRNSQT